jgi:hypothetical protein
MAACFGHRAHPHGGAPYGLKISLEEAVGTLYVLYRPDVFTYLTGDLGWSVKRYEKWLATVLYRTLLA